jgi:hypothetical protein
MLVEKHTLVTKRKEATKPLSWIKPDASLKKISDILNSEGYTTKEDKQFHPMQVKRILGRKAFCKGIYIYIRAWRRQS